MPKIVYDEVAATYERELLNRLNQFAKAKGSLTAALAKTRLPNIEIIPESEVSSYLNHLKEILGIKDGEIFDYKESYLHDVMDRAIRRKRPCTDRGEEIRDAILWHSVLDIAQESPDKTVIFISQNTKQFSQGDGTLHPDLLRDCSERAVTIKYFTSLDDFGKQHASIIEFINEEWLLASIDMDKVLGKAQKIVEGYAERSLERKLSNSFNLYDEEWSSTGYFNPQQGSFNVETFYVYEMSDGSLRVEASFVGEVEVECEVEKRFRIEEYDYEYEYDFVSREYEYVPMTRHHRREVKYEYVYVYPEVSLDLEIIVRDKAVTSWKILDG
jgi:hypothetical protein